MKILLDPTDLAEAVMDWCALRGIVGEVTGVTIDAEKCVVAELRRPPDRAPNVSGPRVSSSNLSTRDSFGVDR